MRKSENYEMNLFDEEDFYTEELVNENTKKIDEVLESLENPEHDTGKQIEVEELASGESLKVALRKLAKAVADYISHKADKVAHTTAEERAAWKTKIEHLGLESQPIEIKEPGWYRIAMIEVPGSYGDETTFQLGRSWSPLPEMIDFTLIKSYYPTNYQLIVNRRSGNVYTTKVRIVYKDTRPQDNVAYLDVYSDTAHETLTKRLDVRILHDFCTHTNSDERCRWKYLDEYTGELAEIPEGYSAIEFNLTKHQIQADTARIKSIESLDADGNTITMQGLFTKIQEKIDKRAISNNFTTTDETMIAAAPLVKQLYEENQSLQEQISTLNSNIHTKTITDDNYYYLNTAQMIVDYAESFENGVTLTTLKNVSVTTCCVVFKDSNSITSTVHVYDAYTDKEVVSSVLNTRIVELYKNY